MKTRINLVHSALRAALLAALSMSLAVGASAEDSKAMIEDPSRPDAFYCGQRNLGNWFYCSKPKAREKVKEESPPPAPAPSATMRLDAVTAELRELKARAILEPTPVNVGAYIRFQREQLDRSSLFADVWQRAVWQDPDLD